MVCDGNVYYDKHHYRNRNMEILGKEMFTVTYELSTPIVTVQNRNQKHLEKKKKKEMLLSSLSN